MIWEFLSQIWEKHLIFALGIRAELGPKFGPTFGQGKSLLWAFRQKDANGIAKSGDPNQTAPLGEV